FYDDYEEDPSKIGYWRYQHINWPPDGVHPDAGKTLTEPIDRFYLSGKYTVTHWEVDNTQRAGTTGDATPYNKESNKVDLVFYVDGGGKAPWVTHIKTNPAAVKENNTYTLAVGVDDSEKDTLTLETEVYRNGKSIFTHRRENLQANAAGDYPETLISGLPQATEGVYQVICTVSDYSGVGIKSYKFTVVSEGKITGSVYHTPNWENNRKRFNLAWFSSEVNTAYTYPEYIAMPAPRKRGTNIFWSGEKFMLNAAVAGSPTSVTCSIDGYTYSAALYNTGVKNPDNEDIYAGTIWDSSMIGKWGQTAPQSLTFQFTANYSGTVKESNFTVIVDDTIKYWQLHRAF
ncbi:MAG TPA: hypothetical protein VN381_03550, partial [Anaerovoracaceae bacterium]|nr:hypothetical protein [Anaerovoracaceae bacterium]